MSHDEKGTLEVVKSIRDDLSKAIPSLDENEDASSVERCQDLLDRLSEFSMTVDILANTLIGRVVSSLKSHELLGTKAKTLVKQWKKIAKDTEESKDASGPSAAGSSTSDATTTTATISSQQPRPKASRNRPKTTTTSSSPATSGTACTNSSLSNAESEWAGLSSMRQNICRKFYDICLTCRDSLLQDGINAEALDQLLAPRAAEVEAALWSLFLNDQRGYGEKARSLVFNLRKNQNLTQQVILGQVSSEELVKLKSEDLASAEIQQARAKEAQKLIDSKRLDWDRANEDKINQMCGIKGDLLSASLFTCGRCKSVKTTSTQKQTRSADEPMTVFVLCLNCGKRWKC